MTDNKEYKTTSLQVAAFLYAKGREPIRIDRAGKKGEFIYSSFDDVVNEVESFFQGGEVVAFKYFEAIRALKSKLFKS